MNPPRTISCQRYGKPIAVAAAVAAMLIVGALTAHSVFPPDSSRRGFSPRSASAQAGDGGPAVLLSGRAAAPAKDQERVRP